MLRDGVVISWDQSCELMAFKDKPGMDDVVTAPPVCLFFADGVRHSL